MIPPSRELTGSDRVSAVDPMADIASIAEDARAAGFDQRRLAFVSVHVRFTDRESWERASVAAASSWEVAVYSTGQGHMLRLARRVHPTVRALTKFRLDALAFADASSGEWLSMSIENLQQSPTEWQTLTTQAEVILPAQRTPPAIESDNQVQRMQRGGTA